ncbi:MAG: hypothetical protein GX413_13410 [Acetobacter sp.]|nr:hypothetical protein [Acetobacter sp.]
MRNPWFGVKTYGIGVAPKNLAGWISTGIYCFLMVSTPVVRNYFDCPAWMIPLGYILITAAFLALLFIKGDGKPWRWRQGHD